MKMIIYLNDFYTINVIVAESIVSNDHMTSNKLNKAVQEIKTISKYIYQKGQTIIYQKNKGQTIFVW